MHAWTRATSFLPWVGSIRCSEFLRQKFPSYPSWVEFTPRCFTPTRSISESGGTQRHISLSALVEFWHGHCAFALVLDCTHVFHLCSLRCLWRLEITTELLYCRYRMVLCSSHIRGSHSTVLRSHSNLNIHRRSCLITQWPFNTHITSTTVIKKHSHHIRFCHVQFTYPNSKQYIKANNSSEQYINAMLNYTHTILGITCGWKSSIYVIEARRSGRQNKEYKRPLSSQNQCCQICYHTGKSGIHCSPFSFPLICYLRIRCQGFWYPWIQGLHFWHCLRVH